MGASLSRKPSIEPVGVLPYPEIAPERTAVGVPGPPSRQPRLHRTVPQGKSRHVDTCKWWTPEGGVAVIGGNDRTESDRK
jgi:hypothetical protein